MPDSAVAPNRYLAHGVVTAVATVASCVVMARADEVLGGSGDVFSPLLVGFCVAPIVIATAATLQAARSKRRRARPVSSESLDWFEDVSRRLTVAAAIGTIDRAIVRESVELVPATCSALIRRHGDDFTLAHASKTGMLLTERLADGLVGRVTKTGEPVTEVSTTEPAISNLPVALAAVPLIDDGEVEAVLVLVRHADVPFESAERDTLIAFGAVAADALHGADAIGDIRDHTRFDADLQAALDERTLTALVVLDLDYLATVNDVYGSPAGDALLRGVACVIRDSVRPTDSVYRFGGGEFCVLARETGNAEQLAERLRAAISDTQFDVGPGTVLDITASFGVANASSDARGADGARLLAHAEAALYEAKHGGRDRVCTA